MNKLNSMHGLLAGTACLALLAAAPACAVTNTINWTTWSHTFTTSPTAGSASGTEDGVGVSYSGEVEDIQFSSAGGAVEYTPTSTYADGTVVTNAPTVPQGSIKLIGAQFGDNGAPLVDTITFGTTVHDPVIAIWSLGQSAEQASFDFNVPAADVVLVATGPDNPYNGGNLTLTGNVLSGNEGGGTVEFLGNYSSISWTNPQAENYYDFTVGVPVPEPASWALLLVGFAGLGGALRARRTSPARA